MSLEIDEIGGQMLGVARGHVTQFPVGRVCQEPGCRTRLSVYNSRPKCAVHDFDASLMNFRSPVLVLPDGTKAPAVGRPHRSRAA